MSAIRELRANFTAKVDGMRAGLNTVQDELKKTAKQSETTSKTMSQKMEAAGKSMKTIGTNMTKYITAPIVALGGIAFASANEFDKAMKTIRVGTGATGDNLAALEQNFKNVLKNVPESAELVSQALADLNTRTGATGTELETLTTQFLELGRVSGEDVPALIAAGTRAFGDWDIAVEDQAATMDYFWKVSQNTGIGVTDLMGKVVQFGAPLRQMGFDFETSAALLGKFEKEGVNAELVMGSMRQALGRMARDGIDAETGLNATMEAIKGAGSASEANAIAIELFGARAGPDMAAAIREGRFEIDDLIGALNESEETIGAAAAETETFGEKVAEMKNRVMLAVEPLGRVLMDMADKALPPLLTGLEKATDWLSSLSDEGRIMAVAIAGGVAAIGPLVVVAGTLVTALAPAVAAITAAGGVTAVLGTALAALTGPVGIAVAAIAGVVVGGAALVSHLRKDSIPEVDRFGDKVSEASKKALESFFTLSDGASQALTDMRLNNTVVTELMADELIAKYEDMNTEILEGMRTRHAKELADTESFFMNSSALTSEREDEILRQMEIRNKAKETTQQHYEDRIEQIVELAATERRELTESEYAQIDAIHKEMNENAVIYLTDNEKDQKIILERMVATASDLSARQAAEVVKNSAKQRDETIADAEKTYNDRVNWAITQRDETGAISEEEAAAIIREAQKTYDQSVKYATDTHEEVVAEAKKQAKGHVDQVDWQTGEILSKWDVYKRGVIQRFHDTNKENLADFKRWGKNMGDEWKLFNSNSDGYAKSFRKLVGASFKYFFNESENDFGKWGGRIGDIFVMVANNMAKSLESGVNNVIKGVNWVLNQLGSKTKFGYWAAPRVGSGSSAKYQDKGPMMGRAKNYAHGTDDHPGGLALVGDGTGSNRGPELIEHPDGRQELSPERPTLMNLMKGARVWSATMTRKLLGKVPRYAGGTLGAIHDWAAGKLGRVADIAGDVWNYMENPKKLLDLALKGLGISAPSGKSAPMELAKAGFNRAKTAAVDFVKNQFGELMGGDGAFGGGGFVKGAGFPGMRKTSSYGFRIHPITKRATMHQGDDWGAPQGTPIPAQAPGVVVQSGYHSIRGNYVRVKTGAMERIYQHNVRNAVRVGDTVRKGQIVGYVGRTGRSTGPHLHYEVLRNGRNINPRGYEDGGIVDKKQLAWLAEGGWAESVISHDPAKRTTQKDIWRKTGEELGFATENGMTGEMIGLLERIALGVESDKNIAVILDGRKVGRMTSSHSQQEAESEKRRAQLFNPRGV